MRLNRWVAGSVVGGAALLGGVWWSLRAGRPAAASATATLPPLPHRVTVEVLNAARIPGASRVATLNLRRAGLDVVYFGNGDTGAPPDRTQIVVRRGDTTGVGRAVAALGPADVVIAPDSSREADLTVLLGRTFGTGKTPARQTP